ncbi:MAG: hypothetical protein ACOCXG_03610 [Nanoarchaeota archaeon]
MLGAFNKKETQVEPKEPKKKSFNERLEELVKSHIGDSFVFSEGVLPLEPVENSCRVYREILGIKLKEGERYELALGKELILGGDIEVIENSEGFNLITPYKTGALYLDTMLESVRLGNLISDCEFVFPNPSGNHMIGQGFEFSPYFLKRK